MVKLINPRGRAIEVDEQTIKNERLLEKGFVLAGESVTVEYLPNHDVEAEAFIPEKKENVADINFVTTLWTSNGMGRVGEEILLELDKLGYKINVIPAIFEKEGLKERTLELVDKKYSPSRITLGYCVPQVLETYKTDINYIKLPWDTTLAPKIWVDILNKYATKVFPDSPFSEKALKEAGLTVSSKVIKDGVRHKDFPYMERDWSKTFYFMTSGDLSIRKGVDVLLDAFEEAFPGKKDVGLIIKSNHPLEWGKLSLPEDKRIKVITDRLSPREYLKLLKKAHCFVFPSRAEGFGLPPLEAMSTGMPVILHNWSALSAMVNDRYNYPIGSSGLIKATPEFYPAEYEDIGDWCNPNRKELVEMMKYVYQRRNEAKRKGKKASNWVRKMWGWEKPIREMMGDILGEKKTGWGEFYRGDTLTKNNVQDSINSHKELFWLIRGFYPTSIIEAGTGTGEMAAWLTWKEQKVLGKEPTRIHAKEVFAVDNDPDVLKIARVNMDSLDGKAKLVKADVFTHKAKADVLFAQGMLEHLSDEEMKKLIDVQLEQAPVVIHSIPNDQYGKLDYGNERLLPDQYFYDLFEKKDLTILRYWGEGDVKKQSILVFKRGSDVTTSIIMPVWNAKDMTIKAIERVRKYTHHYELIVIDNNSNDGIEKWLDKQEDIITVHLSENVGVPKAKNIGMALAKGYFVCFLDNDTEVGEHWLDALLDVFKDQSVGFTAHEGYLIDVPNKTFNAEKITSGLMQWASGSCFVFPRKLIKQVGMLIDRDQWCGEDVDYCMKIRKIGYKGKLPDRPVSIVHLGSITAKKLSLSYDVERFRLLLVRVWSEWEDFIINGTLGAKIDIGVGDAPYPDFLHVDIQNIHHVDVVTEADKLPFPDNSIEIVRNAHLIEHISKDEVGACLREWYRVLEINGTLRVICPDFLSVCRGVANGDIEVEQGMKWIFGGKKDKYDFHLWGYTEESLIRLLEENGFTDVHKEDNPAGWLQVVGKKQLNVKTTPMIGFYNGHHHVFGGGENLAFRTFEILQKNYANTFMLSDGWLVNPKQAFGIDVVDKKPTDENFDVFINFSHGKLLEPKGKKNIAFIFYPQFEVQEGVAKKYDTIVTQSKFVQEAIKKNWGLDSTVIYPPTDIEKFYSTDKKKQILCVGRFIKIEGANNKNQDVLVDAFKKLGGDWKLVFVGSNQEDDYYNKVKKMALGLNVEFKEGLSVEEMRQLYAESKILWHAAGYEATNPSGYEHFGMVAVEALASGCRVLAYGEGGIIEVNGVESWHTVDELLALTNQDMPTPRVDLYPYSIGAAEKGWKKIIELL